MTGRAPQSIATNVSNMVRALMDAGYRSAAGSVMQAIERNGSSGIIARRLTELDNEVMRLEEAGKMLTPDNAVLRALMADFEDVMQANRALVNSAGEDLQTVGARIGQREVLQTTLGLLPTSGRRAVMAAWNTPSVDALLDLIGYTQSDAWQKRMARYGDGVPDLVSRQIQRMFLEGRGPREVAGIVRQSVEGMPAYYAKSATRTLMVTSYRDTATATRVANSDILEYQVRVAAIEQDRTCVACTRLHGTRMELGERVDDHHNGRCSSVCKVRGFPLPSIGSGTDYFERLPEDTQRKRMGAARYEAWQAGAITWDDMVRKYDDPVFGQMVGEASLKGALGPAAQEYYQARRQET